jgi:hypothetical protein
VFPIYSLNSCHCLLLCFIFKEGAASCSKQSYVTIISVKRYFKFGSQGKQHLHKSVPLLVCCEPLKICKSLIFPYLENKSVNSVSDTFFGSIPMKSLCSASHGKCKHECTIHMSLENRDKNQRHVYKIRQRHQICRNSDHTKPLQLSISIFYLQRT